MNQEKNIYPQFYVQTLGGFSISGNGRTIKNDSRQSKKTWILLEYLLVFQNKEISSSELIEAIWGGEDSANPSAALKTLLFRSRKLLEPLDIPAQTLLVYQGGAYTWTKAYETKLDIDEFEQLCKIALSPTVTRETSRAAGIKAAELYKGDFLPGSAWESWVIPISAYYHNLYLKNVHYLLDILFSEQSYQQVIALCRQAILVEKFDEDFHYYLIYALYKTGNVHAAMEHYVRTSDMFYNEFAFTPSDKLKDLYIVIQKDTHEVITDLAVIQSKLHKTAPQSGAFFCEYPVFKEIYYLESRSIERTGDSVYLCLITLEGKEGSILQTAPRSRIMEKLCDSILKSLRRGDVCSRYSANQFILLLPSATYQNGEAVLERIIHKFYSVHPPKTAQVSYSLQAVLPYSGEQAYK